MNPNSKDRAPTGGIQPLRSGLSPFVQADEVVSRRMHPEAHEACRISGPGSAYRALSTPGVCSEPCEDTGAEPTRAAFTAIIPVNPARAKSTAIRAAFTAIPGFCHGSRPRAPRKPHPTRFSGHIESLRVGRISLGLIPPGSSTTRDRCLGPEWEQTRLREVTKYGRTSLGQALLLGPILSYAASR